MGNSNQTVGTVGSIHQYLSYSLLLSIFSWSLPGMNVCWSEYKQQCFCARESTFRIPRSIGISLIQTRACAGRERCDGLDEWD